MRTCTNLELTGNSGYIKSIFLGYHTKHLAIVRDESSSRNCKCPWVHENIKFSNVYPEYHTAYLIQLIDHDKLECLIDFIMLMETRDHLKTFMLNCVFHTVIQTSRSSECIAYFYNGYRAFVDSQGLDSDIVDSLRQKYTKKEQDYIREVFLDLENYDRVNTLADLQRVYSTRSSLIFYGIEHFNDKIIDFKTFCGSLTSHIFHENEKNIQYSRNRMKIIKRYYTKKIWNHAKDSEADKGTLQDYFIKTFFKKLSIVSDLSMYVYYDSSFWRSFYKTHYPDLQCTEFANVKQLVDEKEAQFQHMSQVIHSGLTGKIPEDVIKYCVVECF